MKQPKKVVLFTFLLFLCGHDVGDVVGVGAATCVNYQDVDFYGNDIKSFPGVSSFGACCDLCSAYHDVLHDCLAFTWTANDTSLKNMCYLKYSSGGKMTHSGWYGGVVHTDGPCSTTPDIDFFGNDIEQVYDVTSSDDCCSFCSQSAKCNAFSWSGSTPGLQNICYLKSSVGTKQTRQGFTAGQKNLAKASFTLDINGKTYPFTHFWERCVGSGHAALAKRDDYRTFLKTAKNDIGIEMIRFHGLFDDDMHVVTSSSAAAPYNFNFTEVNEIYDFFLSIGVRPIVELGFMPPAMASGNRTVFVYQGNVTPPKNYSDWGALVEAAALNWKNRYGETEVSKWYFEVWNEPNYPSFWTGTQSDYFQLYQAAALAIKKVFPNFRVGGPASSGLGWITDLKKFCVSNSVPLDFISTHNYPGPDQDNFLSGVQSAHAQASPLPLIMTEYSAMLMSSDLTNHDSAFGSSFVARTVPGAEGIVDVLSYWTFSDVFEENGLSLHPFRNVYGLMNINGIPKPVYRAFQLLHGMSTVGLEVTPNQDGKVFSYATVNGSEIKILISNFDAINYPPDTASVHFDINLGSTASATVTRIDGDYSNSYVGWLKMGRPDPLSQSQITQLMVDSALTTLPLVVDATGFDIVVPTWGVALVTIQLK